jgi:hypothetical protein
MLRLCNERFGEVQADHPSGLTDEPGDGPHITSDTAANVQHPGSLSDLQCRVGVLLVCLG